MTRRPTALALFVTASLGGVLALYYLVHKPVSPAQALAIGQSLANVAVAGALALTTGGLGYRLLRAWVALPGQVVSSGTVAFLASALGLGALGLAMLVLGTLGLYYSAVVWVLVGGLGLWLWRDIRHWAVALGESTRALRPQGRLDRLAAVLVLVVFAFGFLRALAPPVMWDALVYHLTLPELYIRGHSLWLDPSIVSLLSGSPQITEMLYTAAKLLRIDSTSGNISAQLLGSFFGACLGLGVATHAQALKLPAWLAPAILFSSVSVALQLAWAYTELLLMLFALATLIALHHWQRQRSDRAHAARWLILAGLFAGLASSCKFTGLIVPLGGGVAVLATEMLRPIAPGQTRWRQALQSGLLFGLVAFLVFAPWLLKNWRLTGNPVYPLLWPAADMDALRQWQFSRPGQGVPVWRAALILAESTFWGVQSGNAIDVTLGPLFLIGSGLLVLTWRSLDAAQRRQLQLVVIFAAAAYVGWGVFAASAGIARQARLFFSILPLLALLGTAGLAGSSGLDTAKLKLSVVIYATVGLVLSLTAFEMGVRFISHNPLPYVLGMQSAVDYETQELGWYIPAMTEINRLPAGSQVIFLWEPRALSCSAALDCLPDVVIDRWWHARRTGADAAAALGAWRLAGATHILVHEAGARFVQTEDNGTYELADWDELDRLRDQLRVLANIGDVYTLYAMP